MPDEPLVLPFHEIGRDDTARVGGKNASLGEMIRHLGALGVRVPGGFATTAHAYREFLAHNELEERIRETVSRFQRRRLSLAKAGETIRKAILAGELTPALTEALGGGYRWLAQQRGRRNPDVAVRSSATAEDLPEASFAGQQESFLNIRGQAALEDAVRRCYASLFTDRAISYRENHGFDHLRVALSVGVQFMVRSDKAGAGVLFSIDPETGFPNTALINASWGLGEAVVGGEVDPDEYVVFKPLLAREGLVPVISKTAGRKEVKIVYGGRGGSPTRRLETSQKERAALVLDDAEILQLARWAHIIEAHYRTPMDIEWAKDGATGELYIVQARPETVQSRKEAGALKSYRLKRKGKRLLSGLAVGEAIAAGPVCRLKSVSQLGRFKDDAVLVTGMTDPDWVPVMKRAAAIVTDYGGRTSHAAIVSRELGLPAIVGTGDATRTLKDGQAVTVSCAEGDRGHVYEGTAEFETHELSIEDIPQTRTQVMLNLANPAAALRWWRLPADGIGLARMEFIINNHIKIHPLALARWKTLEDGKARRRIRELTGERRDKSAYFVERLAEGIARIAATQYPRPAIVRMSDFKTNEYAALVGGRQFEPREPNPMLGWRGASRYYSEGYRDGFALECRAIRWVRETIGLDNVVVMIPFCRTPEEADRVLEALAGHGLVRGQEGLKVYMMCEIPANVVLAGEFAERFDGFSIGSNDLTQLVLGIDRDSERLAELFDERHRAVTTMITYVIHAAHARGTPVGLCGEAPSNHPEFARLLVHAGIDSMSVNPDSFVSVKRSVAAAERELPKQATSASP
ncbi:MAG TPA: phosphoenolpyruvate synthase [Pelomicrobium sp.]|nr:phosphoenolpyruvate synthase [Pelomicrobium sp.]